MTRSRLAELTLLVCVGFILTSMAAAAQDPPLPSKKADSEAINGYKDGRGIRETELPEAKKQFQLFAQYYADVVKHPLVYKAAQDPSTKDPSGRTIPWLDGPNGAIPDLNRFILEPLPLPTSKVTADQGDYIREMGIALDAALKPLILENPEKIVRINATRMLAVACKSGATAHYPTLIEILKNANIPIEIKYYALAAAGNLLTAYDAFDMKSRRHSNGWKQMPKGAGDKELAELVVEIERFITQPAVIMSGVPNFELAKASPDQLDVIRYIRRQAIKALGQVRFVAIPGVDGNSTLYPAYTLARVCVSDPTLGVLPSPSECAEAVIGLCNMSPVTNGNLRNDYSSERAVEAVAAGLETFATPRAELLSNRTLPWRGYSLRLSEALKQWRGLFDPLYNPTKPANVDPTSVPKDLTTLIQSSQSNIFTPMDKVGIDGKADPIGGQVNLDELRRLLKEIRERPDRKPLFTSVPATSLYMPGKK